MPESAKHSSRRSFISKSILVGSAGAVAGLSGCMGDDNNETDGDFPTGEITVVLATSEGGPTDILLRNMQNPLEEEVGQPIVPDYRAGGGGLIGLEHFWQQEPDGYTLCFNHTANTILNAALEETQYEPTEFEFIASTAETFLGWFSPTGRFDDWDDFIDTIMDEEVTTGTVGPEGSITHFELMMGLNELGVPEENINNVPFDGGGDVSQAVAAEEIDVGITDPVSTLSFAADDDLEALLISSPEELSTYPDARYVTDLEEDMPYVGLSNVAMGPPGMDSEHVEFFEDAILNTTSTNEFQEWAEEEGYSARGIGAEEVAAEMEDLQSLADDYNDIVG